MQWRTPSNASTVVVNKGPVHAAMFLATYSSKQVARQLSSASGVASARHAEKTGLTVDLSFCLSSIQLACADGKLGSVPFKLGDSAENKARPVSHPGHRLSAVPAASTEFYEVSCGSPILSVTLEPLLRADARCSEQSYSQH